MRIQYSIKSFFGMVLLAGLSLGWWTSSQRFELIQLRHQLLLYDWVEPLEVKNSSIIHYRLLSFRSGNSKIWRVYVPDWKKYELQCIYFLPSDSSKSQNERIVARIPMSAGRSIIHAEWRRDSQGAPLVRIATLGPTAKDSHFERAKFPPQFIEAYTSSRELNQTIRGHEDTADCFPIEKIDFVTTIVYSTTINSSKGEKPVHLSGFDICIRDVDHKPLKKP